MFFRNPVCSKLVVIRQNNISDSDRREKNSVWSRFSAYQRYYYFCNSREPLITYCFGVWLQPVFVCVFNLEVIIASPELFSRLVRPFEKIKISFHLSGYKSVYLSLTGICWISHDSDDHNCTLISKSISWSFIFKITEREKTCKAPL